MEPEVFRIEAERQAQEVASLRRKLSMQRAVLLSCLFHGSLLVLVLLFPETAKRPEREASARVIERDPPIPIAFVVPAPPPAPPPTPQTSTSPPQVAAAVLPDIPPPDERYEDVPLRMQPTPDRPTTSPQAPRSDRSSASGRQDERHEGGESGGDRETPSNGSPPDLSARLREFRQALGRAMEDSRESEEGSGTGRGGASLPELPNAGFGVGDLQFESRDYDWGDYRRAIYVAIWRAWYNRLLISAGVFERWSTQNREPVLDHRTVVRFVIERSGGVTGVEVETPSGCYPLDDSAADALRAVILPPLPSDFPRERENVRAIFVATGEVRMMRPHLEWLKQRGHF